MKIVEKFSVNNIYYKNNVNKRDERYTNFQNNGPKGLMLHSVGCAQDDAIVFANTWNKASSDVAVHAVLQADGTVYQCLPWNFRGIHAGGEANNSYIGVEMTEPDCIKYIGGSRFTCSNIVRAREQVTGTYNTAVELFAHLCKMFSLDPMKDGVILSHAEGHDRGVASNHGDPTHLWDQLHMSYTMDGFRRDVRKAMAQTTTAPVKKDLYRVRKAWENVASQVGAFTDLNNAKSACDTAGKGYCVFDEAGKIVYPAVVNFEVGDKVKLVSGAKYTSGASIPSWVFNSVLYVRELQGNNVVISTQKTGAITGVVDKKYLNVYGEPAFKEYLVKVTADALNIRAHASTSATIVGCIRNKGVYTIVEERNGWGLLKSYSKHRNGWICLEYTEKV